MVKKVDLSIVIASFNTKDLLASCIESIKKFTEGITYEVIVVDNASTDGSAGIAQDLGAKVIRNSKNLGFGYASNQGMKISEGRYVLLLNSDTQLKANTLKTMVSWMDDKPGAGVVGCRLVGGDGKVQLNGGSFPTLPRVFLWSTFLDDIPGVSSVFGSLHLRPGKKIREQDWVSGAFFLIKKEIIKKVGFFDEKIFMYGEEVDYCYRIKKAGWKVYYVPIADVTHFGYASSAGEVVKFLDYSIGKQSGLMGEFKGLKLFYKKHLPRWQYPILVLALKVSAFARMFLFGILGGQKQALKIYAKILITA